MWRALSILPFGVAAVIAAWRFGLAAEMGASSRLQLADNQARAIELDLWEGDVGAGERRVLH